MKIEAEGGSTMIVDQPKEGAEWSRASSFWENLELGKRYYLPVVLGPMEKEGLPASCPILPGVATYGMTKEEALEHARAAILGILEEYRTLGQEVPWQVFEEPSLGGEIHWIRLDVE